ARLLQSTRSPAAPPAEPLPSAAPRPLERPGARVLRSHHARPLRASAGQAAAPPRINKSSSRTPRTGPPPLGGGKPTSPPFPDREGGPGGLGPRSGGPLAARRHPRRPALLRAR